MPHVHTAAGQPKEGGACLSFMATLVGEGSAAQVSRNLVLPSKLPPPILQVPLRPRELLGPPALEIGEGDQQFQETCSSH